MQHVLNLQSPPGSSHLSSHSRQQYGNSSLLQNVRPVIPLPVGLVHPFKLLVKEKDEIFQGSIFNNGITVLATTNNHFDSCELREQEPNCRSSALSGRNPCNIARIDHQSADRRSKSEPVISIESLMILEAWVDCFDRQIPLQGQLSIEM